MASSASRAASVEELKARGNDRFAKGDLCGAADVTATFVNGRPRIVKGVIVMRGDVRGASCARALPRTACSARLQRRD